MTSDLEGRAAYYHENLPGLVAAALNDHGISSPVIASRQIGWNGKRITIPIREASGRPAFIEEWHAAALGTPVEAPAVEFFGFDVLAENPNQVLLAEGVHEALILESQGFRAVAATGSGRFFKEREWGALLSPVPDLLLAYRRGERGEQRHHLPSRTEVVEKALRACPQARVLTWPEEVGHNGGAYEFFVTLGQSATDLANLIRWS